MTGVPRDRTGHHIAVREEWLARTQEDILEPGLPIIDPHHHLWDRPSWRYLLDDLLADTNSGHDIRSTVFVQCRAFERAGGDEDFKVVGETEFVAGVAAMSDSGVYGETRVCEGIVGRADLTLGDRLEDVLDALVAAGGGRFRGIRHIVAWDTEPAVLNPGYAPPPHFLLDERFQDGLKRLGKRGLTFDAWLYHPQISELAQAARVCPETNMVLDHVGGPLGLASYAGRRDEIFAGWKASIQDLAGCPNVYVKLGGLGMLINGFGFEDAHAAPGSQMLADAWRPYIETCIEAFGPSRCMFESNFPVDKGSYSYPVFWNACKLLAKGATDAEKADLFAGTAQRFYNLKPAA